MPGKRDAVGHSHQTPCTVFHQTELEIGKHIVQAVPVAVRDRIVKHELRPRLRADLIHGVAKVRVLGVCDYCEIVPVHVIPPTSTIGSRTCPSTRALHWGALEFLWNMPML